MLSTGFPLAMNILKTEANSVKMAPAMESLRDVYAAKALGQIPRLLGNLDRNPLSPTYGCFHRDYWLDKTSDFPDAVRQFGVHSLALVYKFDFPGSAYKGKAKIRDWAIAGMEFWTRIQHPNGSFDEFYPYERGWAGPTAFTTYVMVDSFQLLKDEISLAQAEKIKQAIRRAAYFISSGEAEEDHLANHHAIACLAVWKAYRLLKEPGLKTGFEKLWKGFLGYQTSEGWSQEYDGVDPGYLSATVSFLSKLYKENPLPEILQVLKSSIEFCSYFVYPNGFYAGSLGSRNTLHFYPHGFELLGRDFPLAARVAEEMLISLAKGKLVPPEIISDRYVFYRVPEFLQAYLDYSPRPAEMPLLPYEKTPFSKFFAESKIWIRKTERIYSIANLAKGGVVKAFNCETGELILNDCGILGRLSGQKVVTSQWIDPGYESKTTEEGWEVSGSLNVATGQQLFTPLKGILFRTLLLLIGWHPSLAHFLKGQIRKRMILGRRPVAATFKRTFKVEPEALTVTSRVNVNGRIHFEKLSFGDEFSVRYVPQSRYFQQQELEVQGKLLAPSELAELHQTGKFTFTSVCKLR